MNIHFFKNAKKKNASVNTIWKSKIVNDNMAINSVEGFD